MLIPAWHIAILWMLYAIVYLRRFMIQDRRQRFLALGMGINRSIFALVYLYLTFAEVSTGEAQVLVRWSLFCFLTTELVFIYLEYLMRRKNP